MPVRYSLEEAKNKFKSKGFNLLEEDYTNNRTKLKVEKDGYIGLMNLDSLQSGKSFAICHKNNPYSIQNIQSYLDRNSTNAKILSDVYTNNSEKLKFQCKCGEIFYRSWSDLCATSYAKCPKCSIEERASKRRVKDTRVAKEFEACGYKILKMDYKNIDTRILCEDGKGYIGYFSLHGLRAKHEMNPFNQPDLLKDYKIHNLNNYLRLNNRKLKVLDIVGISDNLTTEILLCQCPKCGKQFEIAKATFFFGKDCCFKCANTFSHYSVIVENWLKDNNINFIREKKFKDCVDKISLPFDFYVEQNNVCIEVDGEGHFYPVNFKGTSDEKALSGFQKTKKHDKIKDEYCKNNGVRLVRISYIEIKNKTYKEKLANIFKGGNL